MPIKQYFPILSFGIVDLNLVKPESYIKKYCKSQTMKSFRLLNDVRL